MPRGIANDATALGLLRLAHDWVSLGASYSGGGLHNYGFTVFFLPVTQELGLSRYANTTNSCCRDGGSSNWAELRLLNRSSLCF
jgi:hypothetical protein